MVTHGRPKVIAAPHLLRAAISDGDAATMVGPAFRRATTTLDAQRLNEAIELAHLVRQLGFDRTDFDRFAGAFTQPNPGRTLARWADTETRPGIRRALAVALVTIEEEVR